MLVLTWLACAVPDEVTLNLHLENVAAPGSLVASDDSVHDVKFAPGLVVVHDADFVWLPVGEAAEESWEHLAEDGDPEAMIADLSDQEGVYLVASLAHEDEATYQAAPMLPGQLGRRQITGPGDAVVDVAFMFGESNDVFVATTAPVPLWTHRAPNAGDWTPSLGLFDAGTEVNEEPGLGPDQAPRQAEPGQGEAEGSVITAIDGVDTAGFAYPAVAEFAALTALEPE